jgi:hypothetical protein
MDDLSFKTGDAALLLLDAMKGTLEPCHPSRQGSPLSFQFGPHFLNALLALRTDWWFCLSRPDKATARSGHATRPR